IGGNAHGHPTPLAEGRVTDSADHGTAVTGESPGFPRDSPACLGTRDVQAGTRQRDRQGCRAPPDDAWHQPACAFAHAATVRYSPHFFGPRFVLRSSWIST